MKVLEKGKIKDTWPKGQPCANCKKPINQPISFNLSFSQPKNCDALVVPVVVHVKCLYVLNHKQEVWEENSPYRGKCDLCGKWSIDGKKFDCV